MAGCGICARSDRGVIDAAILQNVPHRAIALKFDLSRDVVGRHRRKHLAGQVIYLDKEREKAETYIPLAAVAQARQTLETRVKSEPGALESPEDVLSEGRTLFKQVASILTEANRVGDNRVALHAAREARELLNLFGRAFKMFDEGTTIDRSTKIINLLGKATEDDLRGFLTGGHA